MNLGSDETHLRVSSADVPFDDLRELIGLFHRYNVDMKQLAIFETKQNSVWLRYDGAFWAEKIFGDAQSRRSDSQKE